MRFFPLPESTIFRANGHDAERYLHARTTQDIKGLAPGETLRFAVVTPQAKVQVLGTVLREQPDSFLLFCDGGDPNELATAILQFRVADRVELTALTDLSLLHIAPDVGVPFSSLESLIGGEGLHQPEAAHVTTQSGEILSHKAFPRLRLLEWGLDLIVPNENIQTVSSSLSAQGGTSLTAEAYRVLRIQSRRPLFPYDTGKDGLLAELALDEYASFQKGCYAGQEVLEKIASHGKAPRRLYSIALEGNVPLGGNDTVGGLAPGENSSPLGKVTTGEFDPLSNKTLCFARLKTQEIISEGSVLVNGAVGTILGSC